MICGRSSTSRTFLFGASMAAFLLVGCGLSDYEARIDTHRERLRIFDEETKHLGDLMDPPMLPPVKGKKPEIAWPFEVYLRVPIFVKNKRPLPIPKKGEKYDPTADVEKDNTFVNQNFKFTYYAGDDKDFGMLVAAAKLLPKNPPGKIVANEMTAAEFKARLPGALQAYVFKRREGRPSTIAIPGQFVGVEEKLRPATIHGEGSPIAFEKAVFSENPTTETAIDPIGFVGYYWADERKGRQIALVFQIPAEMAVDKTQFPPKKTRTFKYNQVLVQDAIKWSLKSIAAGEDAIAKRKDYLAKRY